MRLIFVVPSDKEPIGGVIALYEFANAMARRDHDVRMVHMPMWGRRVRSLDELSRYYFEPTIVHYFEGADPASLPDADIVFGTQGDPRLGLPVLLMQGFDTLMPNLERDAFRTRCLKVCVASWLVEVGRLFGVPDAQLRVVPMGIDQELFQMNTPLDERVVQVSMLYGSHRAKGWDAGYEALQEIHAQVDGARITVFGASVPPEPLPPWVHFVHDPTPTELVNDVYNASQVFLQASNYEGFGFTGVEAMACGAALVTTDNGGSRDYALTGETALVVPPGDAQAMAAASIHLLSHDAERARLAKAGHHSVQRFNWDQGALVLEGHLHDYLNNPARFQQAPQPDRARIASRNQGDLAAQVIEQTSAGRRWDSGL